LAPKRNILEIAAVCPPFCFSPLISFTVFHQQFQQLLQVRKAKAAAAVAASLCDGRRRLRVERLQLVGLRVAAAGGRLGLKVERLLLLLLEGGHGGHLVVAAQSQLVVVVEGGGRLVLVGRLAPKQRGGQRGHGRRRRSLLAVASGGGQAAHLLPQALRHSGHGRSGRRTRSGRGRAAAAPVGQLLVAVGRRLQRRELTRPRRPHPRLTHRVLHAVLQQSKQQQ